MNNVVLFGPKIDGVHPVLAGVRTVSTASEWLRLFGHALGAPPRELWPKYGRWHRQQHEPITLTDEQLREWRREGARQ